MSERTIARATADGAGRIEVPAETLKKKSLVARQPLPHQRGADSCQQHDYRDDQHHLGLLLVLHT